MKRSKFTDEQILAVVKEGEAGRKVADVCRTHGITEQTLAIMKLKPGDKVLDLGCGAGWASRLMAKAVDDREKPGQVIGLDVSDEMIRRAREAADTAAFTS